MGEDLYKTTLEKALSSLNLNNFKVSNFPQIIFLCGGRIEQKSSQPAYHYPASLRERILLRLADEHAEIEKNCVVAESFKDYFQKGKYKNLLEFESDIANISSLIVVCLESEGSLVEFGMFSNHEKTIRKLQVFVPEQFYNHKEDDEDSFIKLGPLAELESMREDAVLVYPFPDSSKANYEHIDVVIGDITGRLSEENTHSDFDKTNSGHIAYLIYDIINLAFPIKKPEIESCLEALGIKGIDERRLSSLLYLLRKTQHIGIEKYSGVDYIYPLNQKLHRVAFGKKIDGNTFDRTSTFIEIRSTFLIENKKREIQSIKKRRLVMSRIAPKLMRDV